MNEQNLRFGIYPVITEKYCAGRSSLEVLDAVLAGGARIVQLREKELSRSALYDLACLYRSKTKEAGASLIINDCLDIALAVEADGVHLGQTDLPCFVARKMAPELILGVSTHNAQDIQQAETDGASWINIGPLFATGTKETSCNPLGLESLSNLTTRLPFSVMGGIKKKHVPTLVASGVKTVAMVTEITEAPDITGRVRELQALFV